MMRRARWSELLFAIIALYLALALPFPARGGRAAILAVHWYGMIAVALGLVVALRRPTRPAWVVALGLSAYFLVNFLINLVTGLVVGRWLRQGVAANLAEHPEPAVVLSYAIVGIAVLTQVNVGVRCWQARALLRRTRPGRHQTLVA